ncbi:MAG: hypothetical protein ACFE9T_10295 [Promethearchaeota archaeon]
MSGERSQPPKKKPLKEELPEEIREAIIAFQFNDQLGEFEELELQEDIKLVELLHPDFVLLFVDPKHFRVWIWHGSNTTTRMKFVAAKIAPAIRDRYGIGFKISAVDEGNETSGFKIMMGLEKKVEYLEAQTGPAYEGTVEDLELLESLSREKILLLLEKASVPEGYERKMVIVKNKIFGYREYDRNYLGSVIKEKQLFPLREDIEDGPYLADNYIPRILFSYNNVVLTELLQKTNKDENN